MEIYQTKYVAVTMPQTAYVFDPFIIKVSKESGWSGDTFENTAYLNFEIDSSNYSEEREFDVDGNAYFDLSAYFRGHYEHDYSRLLYTQGSYAQNWETNFAKVQDLTYNNATKQFKYNDVKINFIDFIQIFSSKEEFEGNYNPRIKIWRPTAFQIQGSNHERNRMTDNRLHLFNPVFPHWYDFIHVPISSADKTADIEMYIDGEDKTVIEKGIATNGYLASYAQFGLNSLLINNYIDESELIELSNHNNPSREARRLTIINPSALEPEYEWTQSPVDDEESVQVTKNQEHYWIKLSTTTTAVTMDDQFGHLKYYTNPKKDEYIMDYRNDLSKIMCLRWVDEFGFVQQMCFDIASIESSISSGDDIIKFNGQNYNVNKLDTPLSNLPYSTNRFQNSIQGKNQLGNSVLNRKYNITLVSVPKALDKDLESLMVSKNVVWLKPVGDVNEYKNVTDVLNEHQILYIPVQLTAKSMSENPRKQVITFSATITV